MKDPVTGRNVIQVLGTSSNAGKSTITMAICRFLSRKGYRVAPFKSMNMSLNSVAIEGGYEIPRSQWLQAFAASTPPLKEMSAILLKPEGKNGSQVIVNGKSMGVMSIDAYYRYLVENGERVVKDSLDFLCDHFDVVVAEGAGSPAEINIMDRDIANIYVSAIYNTPAILVGDIERGGVFASLFGTMKLMPRSDLVKGMVINKMRGSNDLLNTNNGWPIGAYSSALNLRIEKKGSYIINETGYEATSGDIKRALRIYYLSFYVFLIIFVVPVMVLLYLAHI